MNSGLVYDGNTIRFMTDAEIEAFLNRTLGDQLIVIVAPHAARINEDAHAQSNNVQVSEK